MEYDNESFTSFGPLLEGKVEEKSSYQPKKKKSKPKAVALKTCTVYLDGCTVDLVEGQVIEGLTSQELAHLKVHKFVQ